jgi:hypothetical protein
MYTRRNTMKVHRITIALTLLNFCLLLVTLVQTRPVTAQNVAAVLRGRAIELLDERGQVRAQLTVEPNNNEAVIRLRDPKGIIRVKMGASEDGSALLLLNETTEPGVHVLSKRSEVSMTLKARDGRLRTIAP